MPKFPKRIAVVTSYFPTDVQPYRGHSAYQTVRQLRHSAEVRVFCPMTRYPAWFPPRHFSYSRVNLEHKLADVEAEYFEYPAVPVVSRPLNPAVCQYHLRDRVAAFHPDLILNYFVYPEGCAAISVGEQLGVRVVLGVIGSDVNRIPDRVTRWHTQRALRRASGVLAVSNQLREQAITLGAADDRAKTIPNGCDLEIFHPMEKATVRAQLAVPLETELIVFVGWLSATKGVHELLKAATELAERRPKLRVALVGEGAAAKEIAAKAESGPLQGRILMPGALGSSGVARWMAAADLFCLPSYAEGCPNVVIEALACGTPVIGSAVGAIPELVDGRSGVLVPPRDAAALARALETGLSTEWDRHSISATWNRSWSTVAEETLALCSQAMAQPVN